MIPHRTGTCPAGDVTLHYRHFGRPGKTPLLMLHGLSFFSYDWIDVAGALATDREVVAMDLRGFGDSTWSPTRDYAVQTNARDILALLDHLGWKTAVLFGHSMGGRHCTWTAAQHPQRIAGLVLGDYSPENAPAGSQRVTQTMADTPDAFASLEDAMRFYKAAPADAKRRARFEAYLRKVEGGYAPKRDTHFRDQFKSSLATGERPKPGADLWHALARVRCPVKVIRGTRSDLFAAGTVARVKQANPRLSLAEIDAGHDIAGDNAEAVIRETRAFLDAAIPEHVPTRGIDHLAFVTDDLPATMDFYTRVLRMRLVHVRRVPYERDRGQPPYDELRHYFFDMGNDCLLAFFEYPKGLAKQDRDLPGGMQHVAFHVPRGRFDALVAHVRSCGVEVIGPVPLGGRFWSAYFYDPNGIRLELATSREESPEGVVDSVLQSEEEARAELATLFADPREVEKWLQHMPLR